MRQPPASIPIHAVLACLAAMAARSVDAQGFAAYITPPRLEMRVDPGSTKRHIFEIQHAGRQQGHYRVYSNDWTLSPDGAVVFSDALTPDSCRPWVAIERRELALEPGARHRYRFEVSPPPGTSPRECRFALMVEGREATAGALQFGGRIAVIVYVAIGGAAPELALTGSRVERVREQAVPVIDVRNNGTAHARLEGYVNATDAQGRTVELAPSDLPILPGETRRIALTPVTTGSAPVAPLQFPVRVRGALEWGNRRLALDTSFSP